MIKVEGMLKHTSDESSNLLTSQLDLFIRIFSFLSIALWVQRFVNLGFYSVGRDQ